MKPKKVEKKQLPAEVKAINNKLTTKNKELQELRTQKKDGKDVSKEIKKTLKYLNEKRLEKKELMKKLGL